MAFYSGWSWRGAKDGIGGTLSWAGSGIVTAIDTLSTNYPFLKAGADFTKATIKGFAWAIIWPFRGEESLKNQAIKMAEAVVKDSGGGTAEGLKVTAAQNAFNAHLNFAKSLRNFIVFPASGLIRWAKNSPKLKATAVSIAWIHAALVGYQIKSNDGWLINPWNWAKTSWSNVFSVKAGVTSTYNYIFDGKTSVSPSGTTAPDATVPAPEKKAPKMDFKQTNSTSTETTSGKETSTPTTDRATTPATPKAPRMELKFDTPAPEATPEKTPEAAPAQAPKKAPKMDIKFSLKQGNIGVKTDNSIANSTSPGTVMGPTTKYQIKAPTTYQGKA